MVLSRGHVSEITQKGKLIVLTTTLRKNGGISAFEKFGIVECDNWSEERKKAEK